MFEDDLDSILGSPDGGALGYAGPPPTASPASGDVANTDPPAGAGSSPLTPDQSSAASNYVPSATGAPSPNGGGILSSVFGLNPQQAQQMSGALAKGLTSVGSNWNKPGIAAFAGSAGASLQGADEARQQQTNNLHNLVNTAIKARQVGDMDAYRRAALQIQQIARTQTPLQVAQLRAGGAPAAPSGAAPGAPPQSYTQQNPYVTRGSNNLQRATELSNLTPGTWVRNPSHPNGPPVQITPQMQHTIRQRFGLPEPAPAARTPPAAPAPRPAPAPQAMADPALDPDYPAADAV